MVCGWQISTNNWQNPLQKSDLNISVVIPNYNRSHDLIRAVKSALAQTVPVLEVLVCDDGSSDDSKKKIEELNEPRVIWIDCGKNGGPAKPRNKGIKQSKGNWVAFLDNDDEWIPTKLEKQTEALRASNGQMCCTNAMRMIDGKSHGIIVSHPQPTITLIDLMRQNSVVCSSVLVKKEFLMEISMFPEEKELVSLEDHALWVRLATKAPFIYVNEALVNYTDSASTSIRQGYNSLDSWSVFEKVFLNFKMWLQYSKVALSKEQAIELNRLFVRIKNKGAITKWDEVVLKLKQLIARD